MTRPAGDGPARFSCWECGAVYQRLARGLYALISPGLEPECRHLELHGSPR